MCCDFSGETGPTLAYVELGGTGCLECSGLGGAREGAGVEMANPGTGLG